MIGNFEFDVADGELRFRIGVDVEVGSSVSTWPTMYSASPPRVQSVGAALMRIVFDDVEPAAAVEAVE